MRCSDAGRGLLIAGLLLGLTLPLHDAKAQALGPRPGLAIDPSTLRSLESGVLVRRQSGSYLRKLKPGGAEETPIQTPPQGLVGMPLISMKDSSVPADPTFVPADVATMQTIARSLPNGEWKQPLDASLLELQRASTINGGASNVANPTQVQLEAAIQNTRRQLARASASSPPSQANYQLKELSRTLSGFEKAYYSNYFRRNFVPDSYPEIFGQSKSAVAIARKSTGAPSCSGMLISPTRILTARHCLKDSLADDLEIWVGYQQSLTGQMAAPRKLPITFEFVSSKPILDFAILKLAAPLSSADGVTFACMATDRVRRFDLLYVVGHPQSLPKVVHDYVYVLFPFVATDAEYSALLDTVKTEEGDGAAASVTASYVSVTQSGATVHKNFSQMWNGSPTIGVSSDTFHGDSGAPVFSRETHRVVGVFVEGQPDYEDSWRAGWKRHEGVLPISEVLAELDASLPRWQDAEKPCIR